MVTEDAEGLQADSASIERKAAPGLDRGRGGRGGSRWTRPWRQLRKRA